MEREIRTHHMVCHAKKLRLATVDGRGKPLMRPDILTIEFSWHSTTCHGTQKSCRSHAASMHTLFLVFAAFCCIAIIAPFKLFLTILLFLFPNRVYSRCLLSFVGVRHNNFVIYNESVSPISAATRTYAHQCENPYHREFGEVVLTLINYLIHKFFDSIIELFISTNKQFPPSEIIIISNLQLSGILRNWTTIGLNY